MKRKQNVEENKPKKKPLPYPEWIEDFSLVSEWFQQYDIETELNEKGIVKISNFLPQNIAESALEIISNIPEDDFQDTYASKNWDKNNIEHKFKSLKYDERVDDLLRIFMCLQSFERFSTFSIGRYAQGEFIEMHDDRAFVDVQTDEGEVVLCSRDIAIVYYLTKDWMEEDGGVFIDHETGDRYVPEFNSMVAFVIPRYHEVTPVRGDRVRYSVFGWFLEPGYLYNLQGDDSASENDENNKILE